MWGNRLGWLISAGIVVVTIGIYAMLIFGAGMSKPTALTTKAGALDPLELPSIPRAAFPAGTGDATSLYQEAMADYRSKASQYQTFEQRGKLADAAKLPGIAAILKASSSGTGKIFAGNPESAVVHGGRRYEVLKPIESPGRATMRVGQLHASKNPAEARKYFNAVFNLGYSLYTERLTIAEFMLGQEFMRVAALSLAELDKDKATELVDFDQAAKQYVTDLPFPQLFNPANRAVVDRNSGDVFNLALNSKERMWRIEAILMMGHYKYFSTNPGNQRGAKKVLAQLAADDSLDPAIKAAVKASQDLTPEDHRTSAQMK